METIPAKTHYAALRLQSPQPSLVFRIREFFHRTFMTHTSPAYVLGANVAKNEEKSLLLPKNNSMKAE